MSLCRLGSIKSCALYSLVALLLLSAIGCGSRSSNRFTIGVISKMPESSPAFSGFKACMTDLGYVEGTDLFYLYREVSDASQELVDNTIEKLTTQDIDLLFTLEYDISMRCKEATKDTGLPILFVSNPFPVEMGLVDSLISPGANLTGVRLPETIHKALEWITALIPDVEKVYLPYNPDDNIDEMEISDLIRTASHLNFELILDEIHSVEETLAAIESLREDIDVIFRIPSRTLNPESRLITETGIDLGIPTIASLLLDDNVLLTFTGDFTDAGYHSARLADKILKGAEPSHLPVETSEAFLIINLKTAEKIGIQIPQEVLSQAKTIIR